MKGPIPDGSSPHTLPCRRLIFREPVPGMVRPPPPPHDGHHHHHPPAAEDGRMGTVSKLYRNRSTARGGTPIRLYAFIPIPSGSFDRNGPRGSVNGGRRSPMRRRFAQITVTER